MTSDFRKINNDSFCKGKKFFAPTVHGLRLSTYVNQKLLFS
jgi:hypothetical protein